ncbi:MAG: tetratricopeptide repeat protein [Sulfuricellaceae bacterium]|nr:tetratricopeptide repeat protein [Sulfuricellaceae bacterium]
MAFLNAGRYADAAAFAHALTAGYPLHPLGWKALGIALKQMGRNSDALEPMKKAASLSPLDADAHGNLGATLHDLGKLAEAEPHYQRALKIDPGNTAAHINLGSLLQDRGRLTEAETSFLRALQINPKLAEAHYNLGNTLRAQSRFDEAASSYRKALRINPDHAQAQSNLGTTLNDLGRQDEAEASLRSALKINPDHAESHSNLGLTLMNMGHLDKAEACFRRAIQINPNLAETHNNLGNILQDLGRLEEAETSYRRALEIRPDFAKARSNLLFLLNYAPANDPQNSFAEARQYGQIIASQVTSRFANWSCSSAPTRLRVGLVSGDFSNHPVGYFLEGILAQLDTNSVELFAYPTHHKTDELTARIKPYFSAWQPLSGLSDKDAAHLIHNDHIHVLIDLSGHTRYNRLPIFAWKPAPVQVSWLGYFATTGVAEIDYLIADPWTLPESEEARFTEKIWRLPETRLCFTPPGIALEVSPLPALTNGYVTFGCFNNLTKMNDDVVAVWSHLLASVPDSRLFLKSRQLDETTVRQHTIERFAGHGINAGRLVLEGHEPRTTYMSAYHRVDIALDPFPYPGGTTSVESLWMGVPVLTLVGKDFLSRQGLGILMNAGLTEWVASDSDDYVALAVTHAGDLHRLAQLRDGLRQQVTASPIMDSKRFAYHFETALLDMWRNLAVA